MLYSVIVMHMCTNLMFLTLDGLHVMTSGGNVNLSQRESSIKVTASHHSSDISISSVGFLKDSLYFALVLPQLSRMCVACVLLLVYGQSISEDWPESSSVWYSDNNNN